MATSLPVAFVLENTVQHYAWGSSTALPRLLDLPNPDGLPWAELWMGAHPKSPSVVTLSGQRVPLDTVVGEHAEAVLGAETARRFENRLPFLFKVLAAGRPLSIQAHPSLVQAREGFAAEDELGIPRDAPHRNYRDANHKPEIICALTRFQALRGFRRVPEILRLMDRAGVMELAAERERLEGAPDRDGLRAFFRTMMTMPEERRARAVGQAVAVAQTDSSGDRAMDWIVRLSRECPGDIGVLAPILLNVVELEPGQAMFLPAGELHAYLEGVGIELMANSDNVLRGGLTSKHVDVPELLKLLTFSAGDVEILTPTPTGPAEAGYARRTDEFVLSVLKPLPGSDYQSGVERRVDVVICTEGRATLRGGQGSESVEIGKGTSVLIPAASGVYRIEGTATLFKASVPPPA